MSEQQENSTRRCLQNVLGARLIKREADGSALRSERTRLAVSTLQLCANTSQGRCDCCRDCFNVKQIRRGQRCLFTHSRLSDSNAARGSTQNTGELYIFRADLNRLGRRSLSAGTSCSAPEEHGVRAAAEQNDHSDSPRDSRKQQTNKQPFTRRGFFTYRIFLFVFFL